MRGTTMLYKINMVLNVLLYATSNFRFSPNVFYG